MHWNMGSNPHGIPMDSPGGPAKRVGRISIVTFTLTPGLRWRTMPGMNAPRPSRPLHRATLVKDNAFARLSPADETLFIGAWIQ